MNSSESTLLDARIANISRVTELWEETYLSLETIAVQTGLSLRLVTIIIEETGARRLRSEQLPVNTSNPFTESILDNQVKLVLDLFNTTVLSVKAIASEPGIHLHYHQVKRIIETHTTKKQREERRIKGVRTRGGLDVFSKRC